MLAMLSVVEPARCFYPLASNASLIIFTSILQVPRPSPLGDRSSTSSGSYSGPATAQTMESSSPNGRDIAPFEAVTCQRLTDQIRIFSSAHTDFALTQAVLPHLDSLADALNDAAVTIRYNAKWFAPDSLTELLDTALDAAAVSSSSHDLSAGVSLIDAVATYSSLPQQSLLRVTQFLARTYYNATRANKTRKLADSVWMTLRRLLESHLGTQIVVALLRIVREVDRIVLESRIGYSRVAGALMVISEKLLLGQDPNLPRPQITELLESLYSAAMNGDNHVRELTIDIIALALTNDTVCNELSAEMSTATLLLVSRECVLATPKSRASKSLVDVLVTQLDHFDPTDYERIAQLCIACGHPLEPRLREALLSRYTNFLPVRDSSSTFDDLIEKLATSSAYTHELQLLLGRSLADFTNLPEHYPLADYARQLQLYIGRTNTAKEAASIMCEEIIRAFVHAATSGSSTNELSSIFDCLCGAADRRIEAIRFLLGVRADVDGAVYFKHRHIEQHVSSLALEKLDSTILHIIYSCESWEIYHYAISELPSWLGNHTMFDPRPGFIQQLRSTICQQLETGNYREPPSETGLSKSNVAVHLVEILTALLSYSHHLTKNDILGSISILVSTARSRDYVVSIPCIHALTIMCYEQPDLISRYMDDVIDQMARMVTQRYLAIHVLLFLAGLSRLPGLYRNNFKSKDYKKIFGVCGNYLQSIRGTGTLHERKDTPSDDRSSKASTVDSVDALPQYVYALAHHVIAFWYIAISPQERKEQNAYITTCLKYASEDGKEVIEDQGLVTIDLMDRIDADEAAPKDDTYYEFDNIAGRTTIIHRLSGLLLITTETALRTAETIVTVRRATGTMRHIISPAHARLGAVVTAHPNETDFISIFPADLNGRTYGRIYVPPSSSPLGDGWVSTLPDDDDAITRAIQSIDRTPGLDSHKAGVIYIGEGQKTEEEILQNVQGSPDYVSFIEDLGTLRRLKDADFNTQGLDRIDDADGAHAVVWNNEVTELVFHITTLMPNNADVSLNTANKKRHIGNDFVNIIFNNSGKPFDFNTFPSQFNAVYIVIAPSARTSFLQTRKNATTTTIRFYSVRVLTRPGYPAISSAASEKIISAASLPGYVRNLALNDCVFSSMWSHGLGEGGVGGEYMSSWRSRLGQVRRLRERYA